jgi:hypothetical protein
MLVPQADPIGSKPKKWERGRRQEAEGRRRSEEGERRDEEKIKPLFLQKIP